ncbi:MAG: hypothetical protein ABIH47_04330 [Candidatus Omnitrophota bacterium]
MGNEIEEKLRHFLDVKQNLRALKKELRLLKSPKKNAISEEKLGNYLSSENTYQTQKSQLLKMSEHTSQRLLETRKALCDALPFDTWVIVKVDDRRYAIGKTQYSEYINTARRIELKVRYPHWLRLPLFSCVGMYRAPTDYY